MTDDGSGGFPQDKPGMGRPSGCLLALLLIFAIIGVAVAFLFVRVPGASSPTPTPTPSAAARAGPSASSAVTAPSAPASVIPRPTGSGSGSAPGGNQGAIAQMDATITGAFTLHVTGQAAGACPIKPGTTGINGRDVPNKVGLSIGFTAYTGAGTYPITAAATTYLGLQTELGTTRPVVYHATGGSVTTGATGGATLDANLIDAGATSQIHIVGSLACP